jgi:DNA-binding NtrC family response regulator
MNADVGLRVVTDNVNRVLQERRASVSRVGEAAPWLLESPSLAPVLSLASKISGMPTTSLIITGELGTGTGDLARWVHDHDVTTCAGRFMSLPGHLVKSFDVRGKALGTLFVEDVENLEPASQSWLLKLVSEREARRVALRIIVSTKRSVPELLAVRHLNQELVHALDVARLNIPPLRERPEEILLLAHRFLCEFAERVDKPLIGFSVPAENKLLSHTYEANVRELRNVVERAVAMEDSDEVQVESIVFYSDRAPDQGAMRTEKPTTTTIRFGRERIPTLGEVEREYLVTLIRHLGGSRAKMSRAMGVSYPTVLKKIARHDLDVRAIVEALDGRSEEHARPANRLCGL